MENLTPNQCQTLGYYFAIVLFAVILGIFAQNRIGFLVGLNLGLTIIIGLWFWKGKDEWNQSS